DPNSAASAGLRDSAGQFDPLAEARKRWPGLASADDQTLYRKLSDPANFRAAFPEYGGLDDATIQRNMARYDPAAGLRTLEAEGVRPVVFSASPASISANDLYVKVGRAITLITSSGSDHLDDRVTEIITSAVFSRIRGHEGEVVSAEQDAYEFGWQSKSVNMTGARAYIGNAAI